MGSIPDDPVLYSMVFMQNEISEGSDFVPWEVIFIKYELIDPYDGFTYNRKLEKSCINGSPVLKEGRFAIPWKKTFN